MAEPILNKEELINKSKEESNKAIEFLIDWYNNKTTLSIFESNAKKI